MLGRTAASLFWMSRYHERAQNVTRLLEVAYRGAIMSHNGQEHGTHLTFALTNSGLESDYRQKYEELNIRNVSMFMIFAKDNPLSVRNSLELARNNARAVRTSITAELWEAMNTTWIEFTEVNPQSVTQEKLPDFLAWINQRAHLFRGALLNTVLRNDGYFFSQMGNFVERADNTARILNTQYWSLLPDNDIIDDGSTERYQWSAILRALSGRRSYRFAYPHARLKAFNIAEFLILRQEMPRSLAHCFDWIADTAEDLAQYYGSREPSLDLAIEIHRELSGKQMRDIYQEGLHDFLTIFIGKNNQFAQQLSEDYNFA
ncbi:alpha-E domain-containing protein [Roseibium aggregatum]|uniref:Alpha-E domain-containing protein n=1 Tax=Roseibium aggregatum TaxID=187304 RepID=A0A939EEZ2_9HYPH|nr:alpha-E domain-containing protein [Roseibium aggregatum]MBN9670928.1 alpha-E domain-containing protein [Roseibium aggregatum]